MSTLERKKSHDIISNDLHDNDDDKYNKTYPCEKVGRLRYFIFIFSMNHNSITNTEVLS